MFSFPSVSRTLFHSPSVPHSFIIHIALFIRIGHQHHHHKKTQTKIYKIKWFKQNFDYICMCCYYYYHYCCAMCWCAVMLLLLLLLLRTLTLLKFIYVETKTKKVNRKDCCRIDYTCDNRAPIQEKKNRREKI